MAITVTVLLVLLFVAASTADLSRKQRLFICSIAVLGIFGVQSCASASTIDMPKTSYYSSDFKPFYGDILEQYQKSKNHLNLKEEHLDNDVVTAIAKAAKLTGVDPNLLATIANIESTMNPRARNKRVKGLMQFTPGTWKMMVRRHAKKYGITKPDIYNPYHNALMAAELLKDNEMWMQKRIKRTLKNHEIYMAHFISPNYALRMIKAKANRAAKDVVPVSFVAENNSLFYRKGSAMTVRQFISNLKHKLADKYFEVTNPPVQMLADISVCDVPNANGSVAPIAISGSIRCGYKQSNAWWDRHITSILTA